MNLIWANENSLYAIPNNIMTSIKFHHTHCIRVRIPYTGVCLFMLHYTSEKHFEKTEIDESCHRIHRKK